MPTPTAPPQLTVLADLVQTLSDVPAVTQLLALMASLDTVMSTEFGALLPGWHDTIVGDLGGAGFVYLLPHDGHLLQLDLCPDTAVDALRRRIGPRLLWQETRTNTGPHPDGNAVARGETTAELARRAAAPADCSTLLVQAMVLHAMLRKRVLRGQEYIAYGLLHQMHTTCRDMIRTALVPHSRHHGWYHLPDEVGRTTIGRECLAELTDVVSGPPVPTVAQADQVLERIVSLTGRIAPQAVTALSDELTAYRAYQSQEGPA